MNTKGESAIKKLPPLLAVLLCSLLTLALPFISYSLSSAENIQITSIKSDEIFSFLAGEVSPGKPEAILQLDENKLVPLLALFVKQLYAVPFCSLSIQTFYTFFKTESNLSSILTKGP